MSKSRNIVRTHILCKIVTAILRNETLFRKFCIVEHHNGYGNFTFNR